MIEAYCFIIGTADVFIMARLSIGQGTYPSERIQALDALSIYMIAGRDLSVFLRSTAFEVILLLGILSLSQPLPWPDILKGVSLLSGSSLIELSIAIIIS